MDERTDEELERFRFARRRPDRRLFPLHATQTANCYLYPCNGLVVMRLISTCPPAIFRGAVNPVDWEWGFAGFKVGGGQDPQGNGFQLGVFS
jgi:hypothetical protein